MVFCVSGRVPRGGRGSNQYVARPGAPIGGADSAAAVAAALVDEPDPEDIAAAFDPQRMAWTRVGFTAAEIRAWQHHGMTLADAVTLDWCGWSPDRAPPAVAVAVEWKVRGWGADDLDRWRPEGSVGTQPGWSPRGIHSEAWRWRAAGVTPEFGQAAERCNVTIGEFEAWRKETAVESGVDPQDVLEVVRWAKQAWQRNGFGYDVPDGWRGTGGRTLARWKKALDTGKDLHPDEVSQLLRDGPHNWIALSDPKTLQRTLALPEDFGITRDRVVVGFKYLVNHPTLAAQVVSKKNPTAAAFALTERWQKLTDFGYWSDEGFGPEEAFEWDSAGVPLYQATRFRDAGMDPTASASYVGWNTFGLKQAHAIAAYHRQMPLEQLAA